MARRSWPRVLVVMALWFVPPSSARALIGDTPTIHAAAVVRASAVDPETEVFALIGETPTNAHQLLLRTIRREDGALVGNEVVTFPDGVIPVDLIFSTALRPNGILVLDESLRVHEFRVAVDAAGAVKLIGDTPTIFGPFGDPALLGAGTALDEAPGILDPRTDGFLGIGTAGGVLLIATGVVDAADYRVDLGKGAISGLGTVPQVGRFVFVAAHNGRAVGVSTGGTATPPSVVFDLADPRPDPFLDLGAVFEPNGEPLTTPAPVPFVAANGTTRVAVLEIPPNPTIGGRLTVDTVFAAGPPIAGVGLGSLVMVEAAGHAVLYDPGFDVSAGPSGTTLTLAGAGVDFHPAVLNLHRRGRHLTARIEVEDGHAADIDTDTPTLALSCEALEAVEASVRPAPRLGDADEDGQADLTVRFDRAGVAALLRGQRAGPVTLAVRWTYDDGSRGCGVSVLRIKKR